jgi:hypothetical protein
VLVSWKFAFVGRDCGMGHFQRAQAPSMKKRKCDGVRTTDAKNVDVAVSIGVGNCKRRQWGLLDSERERPFCKSFQGLHDPF